MSRFTRFDDDGAHGGRELGCADLHHQETAAGVRMTARPTDWIGHEPIDVASIAVPTPTIPLAMQFVGHTALYGVVRIASTAAGGMTVTEPPWRLSSGEALLWRVLEWLCGFDSLPSMAELEGGLDAQNMAAVNALLNHEAVA